jgi:hypothetical protein
MRPKYSGAFKTNFSTDANDRGDFDILPEEMCLTLLDYVGYNPKPSIFSHTINFVNISRLMKTCKFWYRLIRKDLHIWRKAMNYRLELNLTNVSFGPNSYFRMLKHIWKQIIAQGKPFALTVDGHIGWLDHGSVHMTNAVLAHTKIDIYNQVLLVTIGDILKPRLDRETNANPIALMDEFIEEDLEGKTWKYWLQQPVIDFAGSDSGFCMLLENCVIKIGEPDMEGVADAYPIFCHFPPTERLALMACGICTFLVWASNTNTLWGGSIRDIEGGKDMNLVKIAMATSVYKLEAILVPDVNNPENRLVKYIVYMRDSEIHTNIFKPEEIPEATVFYLTNKEFIEAETARANQNL